MEEEQLLEFSGELPSETTSPPLVADDETPLLVDVTANRPTHEYNPSALRIAWLAGKCALSLLLLVLTAAIRKRDFMKCFIAMLLIPILLECGFDVYTEILSGITPYTNIQRIWQQADFDSNSTSHLHDLQGSALKQWISIAVHYTTYEVFSKVDYVGIASYAVADVIFWTSVFCSPIAFFFAHKAINRPEEISYTHFARVFLQLELLPILLATLDCLLTIFQLAPWIVLSVTVLIRLVACIVAFIIVTQAFFSLFLFCRRVDEYTKTSPYDQVRFAKSRLAFFILYQIIIHSINVPYIVWSGLSLAEDFRQIFELDYPLPLELGAAAFHYHLTFFLVRPVVVLLFAIPLLPPFRKKFMKSFCGCCRRD